jgi:DNA-binding winged helix-turn-helix (wHTH) protein/tetratricopeptide (TPR) repeat protein
MPSSSAQTVRFGPFQLDLRAAELHHNGSRTKLAEQPFQILAELVQHPGEVVTRDELRQRLWHSDTFVDFEQGLNTAVKRLREILGDSADHPTYIETIPRRGYRLIVPVEEEQPVAGGGPKAGVRRRNIWLATSAVVVVAIALATGLIWRQRLRRAEALTPSDTIVLADFSNSTGDPVFDDALKQALTVQLEQSPFLNMVSQVRVQDALRLMKRSPDEHLTPDVGRDVCQRVGGKALVSGSIARLGSHYVIGLSATACSNGDLLAMEQTEAANKEEILKALGKAASDLRSTLGESLSSLQKFDAPIEEVTTPSLEALKAYSLGVKARNDKGNLAAIPFFGRAIELDPNFAMAYSGLSVAQDALDRYDLAGDAAGKAFVLRNRVSERERFRISALYYSLVPSDLEQALQVYRQWAQTYPLDVIPHINQGMIVHFGSWEEAAAAEREALRLDPDNSVAYFTLAFFSLGLNQPDNAEATLGQARQHRVSASWLRQPMYYLAFVRGDTTTMAHLLEEAVGKEDERWLLSAQSDTEAYYGRLKRASSFSRRAVESELQTGSRQAAALWQIRASLREAEFGSSALGQQGVAAALALAPSWQVRTLAALAVARMGNTARARAMVRELEKDNPSNTILNLSWLPTIKAAIEMKEGNPTRAITVLEEAAPYELASQTPLVVGGLYPVYLHGQAYLLSHDGTAAAAEFQKLLDHRGIVLNYPLGALAHLQLGRAYAMSGDTAKAKAAYQDFLTLWKDADPDIPVLKQAKAEYAKLQQTTSVGTRRTR